MEYCAAIKNKVKTPCMDTKQLPRQTAVREAGAGQTSVCLCLCTSDVHLLVCTQVSGDSQVACPPLGWGLLLGDSSLEILCTGDPSYLSSAKSWEYILCTKN